MLKAKKSQKKIKKDFENYLNKYTYITAKKEKENKAMFLCSFSHKARTFKFTLSIS